MPLTNRHGLPQTLVNLANRDTYTKGRADISVTEAIGAPRIRLLRRRYADEIVEDVSDRVWALMGSALHHVVQQGADAHHLVEERIFTEIEGWTISGGVDLQATTFDEMGEVSGVAISDYKFTSAYAVMSSKPEWERQLNCYAHLVEREKNLTVTGLSINAVIRDWSRHDAASRDGYPATPIVVVPQRLWAYPERETYMAERVRLHRDAERQDAWGEVLYPCSPEERWYRPGDLAIMKEGRKRAQKLFPVTERAAAKAHAERIGGTVIERSGLNLRCEEYCPVAPWCDQWAVLKGLAR